MKVRNAVNPAIVLSFGTPAFAQDYSKVEVPVNYSYMRFSPENSNVVSAFSPNGGGGGFTVFINRFLGITADFQGYGSLTRTFTFASGSAVCPAESTAAAQGNLFTYNTGLVFKYRTEHFAPFVEALGGGAHSNVYRNLLKARQASCVTSASPSNNAFDFVIGGGFDIPLTKSIAIRPAQFDLC